MNFRNLLAGATFFLTAASAHALTVDCTAELGDDNGAAARLRSTTRADGSRVLELRARGGDYEDMDLAVESVVTTRTNKVRVKGHVLRPAGYEFISYEFYLPQPNLLPGSGFLTMRDSQTGDVFGENAWEFDCGSQPRRRLPHAVR